jgi:hypothetical protein
MNALKWYMHLVNEAQAQVDHMLYASDLPMAVPSSAPIGSSHLSPALSPPQCFPDEMGAAPTSGVVPCKRPDSQVLMARRQLPDQPDHVGHRASEYLRQRCPACFGGVLRGENSSRSVI